MLATEEERLVGECWIGRSDYGLVEIRTETGPNHLFIPHRRAHHAPLRCHDSPGAPRSKGVVRRWPAHRLLKPKTSVVLVLAQRRRVEANMTAVSPQDAGTDESRGGGDAAEFPLGQAGLVPLLQIWDLVPVT